MTIDELNSVILQLEGYMINSMYSFLEDYFINNKRIVFPTPLKVRGITNNVTITMLEQERSFIYAIISGKRINICSLHYDVLMQIYCAIKEQKTIKK